MYSLKKTSCFIDNLTMLFFIVSASPGRYTPKELKSETIGVYQNVEVGQNHAMCAMMCGHLYESKRGYDKYLLLPSTRIVARLFGLVKIMRP